MEKRCSTCKEIQPESAFHVIKKTGKLRPYCRSCQRLRAARYYAANKASVNAANIAYRRKPENIEAQRARVRNWHYRTHYGMSADDKRLMEQAQDNRCAICKTHFSEMNQRRIHVDHCHTTGKVRGILCHNCNQVLGQAADKIDVLESAIKYLLHHRPQQADAFA